MTPPCLIRSALLCPRHRTLPCTSWLDLRCFGLCSCLSLTCRKLAGPGRCLEPTTVLKSHLWLARWQ